MSDASQRGPGAASGATGRGPVNGVNGHTQRPVPGTAPSPPENVPPPPPPPPPPSSHAYQQAARAAQARPNGDGARAAAPPGGAGPSGPRTGEVTRVEPESLDSELVDRLHDVSGQRITRRITEHQGDDTQQMPYEDERVLGRQVIYEVLTEWRSAAYEEGRAPLRSDMEEALAREVHNHLYGLGPLQRLIDDPDVVDIHVGGHKDVWVHKSDGTKVRGPRAAHTDAALIDMVNRQARRAGRTERRWDKEEVALDLQLPDGSRLHALREVTGRPVIDIRCHDFVQFERLSQLEQRGVIDRAIREFLSVAVRCGMNLIVAGGKGMGKTTTLRCLINEIPAEERIITVEDSLELGIERFADLHPDTESIEARPPNSEGHGEFSLAEAVRQGLRMRGRIIVGEVRGDEVIPMLKAMSAGEDGSMCTIHAMSSANVFDRLAMYAAMSDGQGFQPEVTSMLVANAIHFVVYLGWDNSRPSMRRVQSIREVVGSEGNKVISNEIWAPDRLGRAVPNARLREPTEQLLHENGYDLRLRDNPQGWWQG